MSSFTDHIAIAPDDKRRDKWENKSPFFYYTDLFGERIDFIVPAGYFFDGTSVPNLAIWIVGVAILSRHENIALLLFLSAAMVQKIQADTITSACLHDYIYTDKREIGRLRADIIFIESLIVYNIPKLIERKRYLTALIKTIQYSLMGAALILFSRFVRYRVSDRSYNYYKKISRKGIDKIY